MRTITKKELEKILADHVEWLKDNSNGAWADLRNADLSNANLSNANLHNANLSNANLRNANLHNANLRNVDLNILAPIYIAQQSIVPQICDFVAFKKVKDIANDRDFILILRIRGKRLNAIGSRMCRASEVEVISAHVIGANEIEKTPILTSLRDREFIYEVGKTYKVDDFNDDIREEYAAGIHFFITREEAEEFSL